jgi:hypothetical protein
VTTRELEVPRTLPGDNSHLSVSSISTFIKCPERWRRRYIEGEYEPSGPAALLGSAIHGAEGHNFQLKIDTGEDLPEADVLDIYAEEFDLRVDTTEVDWRDEKPGTVKDAGARILPIYHRITAPKVRPKAVERKYELAFQDVDWTFDGYIDVEEEDDGIVDLKVKARALSQADADIDLQPTANLLAKRAEGSPAPEFRFHPLVKVLKPEPKHVQPVVTTRTDQQLDAFITRVYGIAAEMQWRMETDNWAGAVPGSWWCSTRFCGFWDSCPMGGMR